MLRFTCRDCFVAVVAELRVGSSILKKNERSNETGLVSGIAVAVA